MITNNDTSAETDDELIVEMSVDEKEACKEVTKSRSLKGESSRPRHR